MKNSERIIEEYLKRDDWRVKENSTVNYSVGGLILSNSGNVTADYWLSKIYPKEISDLHKNADIHIHDLSMLSGYCAGWSLKQLIQEGLGGVPGKITSSPASHLSTLCNQMVNFLGIMQNEWAGAQALSSFDTYLAPFVREDNLTYKQVKQCIQSFVYGVNTPSRWGTQAPFTNITLDWTVPDDLAYLNCIVGGKELDYEYKDCQKEMDMINKAFIEIMIEGDANGRGFQYPIPTYSITKDFDWSETENNKLLFEMTAKYGTPYFSNYINSDMEPSDVRSMCVLPDTLVWAKIKNKTKHCTIKELFDNYKPQEVKILTKYSYRPVKELQRFEYRGDMIEFVTEEGKKLTTTPDHMHVIYDEADNCLVKKRAAEVKVGDSFSCRHPNPGERRKGKTYEEFYGQERANQIKTIFSEQRTGKIAWNKGIPASLEAKKKISESLKGHYVSENCKIKSSERWKGLNNPKHIGGAFQEGNINLSISPQEWKIKEELDALGKNYIHQYIITTDARKYVPDFYLPDDNLIIEVETNFNSNTCNYNNPELIASERLRNRVKLFMDMGYNVLMLNPQLDNNSYRQYINKCNKIIKISRLPYQGFVYDLEVDCDDIEEDTTMYHTFYANEILTSNCCRLRLDLRELRKKSGGFFGSGESTGSVGVVTINMPRIAYLSENEIDFYERLDHIMDLSAESLNIKRRAISQWLDDGLYPYTKRYLGTFNNHFSTIGLVGMNEVGLNAKWLRKDLMHKETQEFTKHVLNHMRNKLSDYQEKYGDLFNLEATPAESTSFRLAKHDVEKYPDIITAAKTCDDTPYYTNSSHLPVGYTEDIFSALDIQDNLQTLYTSGTVFHAFLGEKLPDWKAAANLVRKIAENYELPYYTLSPTYSVCRDHGYLEGEKTRCPVCNNTTEIYSRITGYYRPVQNWNDGKLQEYKDRKEYIINNKPIECTSCQIDIIDDHIDENILEDQVTLVATTTCPNCKIAGAILDKAGVSYTKIYADQTPEEAEKLGIKQAPTLVVINNGQIEKYAGVSDIKKYLNKL